MINLLPPETKENMLYARRNTVLLRWVFALLIAWVGVGLIFIGGQIYLSSTIKSTTASLEQSRQSLKDQKFDETTKQLEDLSNNTKLILQVLSREVLFSNLLRQLGSIVPPNTTLQSFQVDKLQGGLALQAAAKDIESATQLQVNLQDPANKIFEKADIESINCTAPDPDTEYPCQVQIRALFAKNNPYLYINPQDAGSLSKAGGTGQ